MKNKIQLITYVDRLGCKNIDELNSLVENEFKGLFGGIHILPFFNPIDGADAGFDPIDHTQVDPRIGDWESVKKLTRNVDVMSDLIVNHISAKSKQFQDYLLNGKQSEFAELILTKDKVFKTGIDPADILKIYRPRPGSPFTDFELRDGTKVSVWTTFTANQIDIDVLSKMGEAYLENILDTFHKAGITMIRLDAAGYAIKKPGTSCFMIDETYEFIANLTQKAKSKGIEVLVEIHSFYKTQIEIAKRVDFVYDFALPVLVLDCLFNKRSTNLKKWLAVAPKNVITVLDTHDGIGIVDVAGEADISGLIADEDLDQIVEQIHVNSKATSRKATGAAASNLDLYQVNCTYFDALAQDEKQYLMARAIQFFVPGIPQVYYVGLLAGANDMELLSQTNVGRDINRHYFTKSEIDQILKTDMFLKMQKLMQFRNTHNAFDGEFEIIETTNDVLNLKWTNNNSWAELYIKLNSAEMKINFSDASDKVLQLF
ncbi:sucrose phosphorylase [Aurantibacter crassamenti]|uniref:sucrose phosphorylase n=1 Tax=Aurantibacter crassamenti TaxID=1837375 RepID=UPI001939FFED|nr:sucrose phosphorylase [Aurantibacter crassamenti]MBM1105987.1 sucrose phosphorylase [Aurantibacter crassamenti]